MSNYIQPNVISEEMLIEAIKKDRGKLFQNFEDIIYFDNPLSLKLDYKNILRINNLWYFKSLQHLKLDNNLIENITGLEELINLRTLDLSFNSIENITGLHTLVNLVDLSLFNNNIAKIENLENLQSLELLSIGNNKISHIENIYYLRQFKNLKTINLSGNPLSSDADYKLYVACYLKNIVYLDNSFIDQKLKDAALTKFSSELENLEEVERLQQQELHQLALSQEIKNQQKAAFVDKIADQNLYDHTGDDSGPESVIQIVPTIMETHLQFKNEYDEIVAKIVEFGLAKNEERRIESKLFQDCLSEAKFLARQASIENIEKFLEFKVKLWSSVLDSKDKESLNDVLRTYQTKVDALWEDLMYTEIRLTDQLEEIIRDYEKNNFELVNQLKEAMQQYFDELRDVESRYYANLIQSTPIIDEFLTQNTQARQDQSEALDLLRDLMMDREAFQKQLSDSHASRVTRLERDGEEMSRRVDECSSQFLHSTQRDDVVARNRERVAEIIHFIAHLRSEFANFEFQEDDR